MELHVLVQAADALEYDVRNYKKHTQYSWQWSCEICGDSKQNTRKARFWIGKKDQTLLAHCFNCGYSNRFDSYLRDNHIHHYDKYKKDGMMSTITSSTFDLDRLFNRSGISEETLYHLFFKGDIDLLTKNKVKLSRENIKRLYDIKKKYSL